MKLIHYGSSNFNPLLFRKVINDYFGWTKPRGGLWTAPENSTGWIDFCKKLEWEDRLQTSFKLRLKSNAKILVIDSLQDLLNAPLKGNYLDFELIAQNYDAIYLTKKGQRETYLSDPIHLHSWDVESVLILNADCFEIL